MKSRILPIVSALAMSAFASNAMAYDVRLEVNGELTGTTCLIEGTAGNVIKTVTLPTLSTNALSAAGSSAGRRPVSLTISGCTTETAMLVFFERGGANISPNGMLVNMAEEAVAAGNVQVQLLDAEANVLDLNSVMPIFTISDGTGSMEFFVQYFSPAGGATSGAVTSYLEMSLGYN